MAAPSGKQTPITAKAVPSPAIPVLAWRVPRNPAVSDPSGEDIRSSGLPAPRPTFRTPMTSFHRAWRSFVASATRFFKIEDVDGIFMNNPSYFIDKTLKGREAEAGGLLTWGRFWKLDGPARHGLGINGLMLIHRDGLAAYPATGRRSFRIVLTRFRELAIERAVDLLLFIIGTPVILGAESGVSLPLRLAQVFLLIAIVVRIPEIFRWLISRNARARTRIEALLKRRRERVEERDLREARDLLDKTLRNPNGFVIPWTALTGASFALDRGFRQVMTYGPPSALWTLTWETRDGKRESAVMSVPLRSMGYPELGFADLRLSAELRRASGGVPPTELQQFEEIPGMRERLKRTIGPAAGPS